MKFNINALMYMAAVIAFFNVQVVFAHEQFNHPNVLMSIGTQSLSQSEYSEQATYIQANFMGEYPLSGNINLNYNFRARLNATSKNFNENSERSNNNNSTEIKVVDTELIYETPNFEISGLIINQRKTQFFSRLADRGHLALYQKLTTNNINYNDDRILNADLELYESRILGFTARYDAQSLPELYVVSNVAGIYYTKGYIQNRLSYFALLNADGSMAYDSAILGNSIQGTTAETSIFTHKFEGISDTIEIQFKNVFKNSNLKIRTEYLVNNRGDYKSNQALLFTLEAELKKYRFGMQRFEIGEQTLPAILFNSQEQRVNVDGNKIYLSYLWNHFILSAQYSSLKPIVNKPIQQSEEVYYFSMEKNFEI